MSKVVKAATSVVKSVVSTAVSVVKSVVNTVVSVAKAVVNMVASPFMGLMGGAPEVADSGAAETARQDGVLIQKQGSRENIPVVYGYRKVGGKIIFAETGSTNNQYLWVAYVFSEGCVEGLNEVWIDDFQMNASVVQQLNQGTIVDVTDTKYANRVRLQWFPGVFFHNPSDSPVGRDSICKDAPSWKSSNTFNGCAVLFARYYWKAITTQAEADANPFNGSIPVAQVTMMGRRVSSLREGAGTESYSYGDYGYAERYSTNPAEILLDYLRNPRYGKGLTNNDIDWTSFYAAAAKCNQSIVYSSTVSGPILTLNHVVDTSQTLFSNVKAMLQNFRAYLPYVQGKYKLKIEDAGNPTDILSGAATIVQTFNKDNIVGDITYTAIDKNSKYNYVAVNWVDPDQKWSVQQVVYPADEATRQIYITQDGGRENSLEITMGGITNSQIALDMARLLFYKSRYQESCSFTASAEAMELEPGDNIYIEGNVLAFENVPWRIISLKLNNDYTCDIGCVRNPDFIYPYVQANTPDYVAAPYVPVGSTIKAPVIGETAPVGLYPPSRAPLPEGVTGTNNQITHPNPTVPGGEYGGGVGSGGSQQNTNPTPPPMPPVVVQLTDVVEIDLATYSYSGDVVYVDITFRQPAHAQYHSLMIWYKPNVSLETVWSQREITDRVGPGENITYRIGPIIGGSSFPSYLLKTRVKYESGELSTLYSTSVLTTNGSTTANDPADTPYFTTPGWTLPTQKPPGRRDDILGVIKSISQTDSHGDYDLGYNVGADHLIIRQSLNGYVINEDIIGIKMYYKPVQLTPPGPQYEAYNYWFEQEVEFPAHTYVPGQTIEIPCPWDWTVQPLSETNLSFYWDVIFKFKYVDGSYSRKQTRMMGIQHSYTAGEDAFGFATKIVEGANDYSFQLYSQAIHDGAVSDYHLMTIGVNTLEAENSIYTQGATANIFLTLPPAPAREYIRGFLWLMRKQGTNDPWVENRKTTYTLNAVRKSTSTAFNCYRLSIAFPFNEYYQIAIIPLVYNPLTRQVEEGWNAVFGQYYIHERTTNWDYPATGDWSPSFNFKQISSAWVRELTNPPPVPIGTPFDTVVVGEFNYNWKKSTGQTAWYYDNGTNWVMGGYYSIKLKLDGINGITKIHIYRRSRANNVSSTIPAQAAYYGTSQFEHIEIPIATLAANGYRINLRNALSITMFNSSTFPINSDNDTNLLNNSQFVNGDTSFRSYIPESMGQFECFIVIENNTGICRNAVQLREWTNYGIIPGPVAGDPPYRNMLAKIGIPPTVAFPGTLNDPALGWRRRITEATNGPVPWAKLKRITGAFGGPPGKTFIGVTPTEGPEVI